ncbi:TRAP transporter substrate-binding protein DctP [Pararhodobacter marinus]|nr:TRAP transporter substrate-binding protein DctP [Pararhodobacter marinus]
MKHLFKSALVKSAVVAAGLVGAAAPALADEVVLNAVTLAPRQVNITEPFALFVDEVNERFEGRVRIVWRGGPEVMPPFRQAEGVRNGSIDMAYTSPSYYGGLVPASPTMNLSFNDYETIAATDYHERLTELHEEQGLVLLGEIPATDLDFLIYLAEPIESLDELQGKRIRVFPTLLPLIQALGAEPIVLPMEEIFTAMERGTVDGFVQGPVGNHLQFEGIVQQVIYPGVYRAGFPVLVNPDTWAEIPAETQAELVSFLRDDFAPRMDEIWEDDLAQGVAEMEQAGFQRLELTGADEEAYRQTAMDAAWATIVESAGEEIAAELRPMME